MGSRRGFTLIELVVSIVVAMIVMEAISLALKSSLATRNYLDDATQSMMDANESVDFIESLLNRAVIDGSHGVINMGGFAGGVGGNRGIAFFADLDGDNFLEWVWIWRDPQRPLQEDFGPLFGQRFALKIAAFQGRPNGGVAQQVNFTSPAFCGLWDQVNNQPAPRGGMVIAANATRFEFFVDGDATGRSWVRLDGLFHQHKYTASDAVPALTWDVVCPGSFTTQSGIIPSWTVVRWIPLRSQYGTSGAPAAPLGDYGSYNPAQWPLLGNTEMNYKAAAGLATQRSTWCLRPR